jgi:hypothetical protein
MPRPRHGNKFASPDELRAIVARSGIPVHAFAGVIGIATSTLQGKLAGKQPVQEHVLNAARFGLLRLGIPVSVPPVDRSVIRGHSTTRSRP